MKVIITFMNWTRCGLTFKGGTEKEHKKVVNLVDDALAIEIPGSHFIEGVRSGAWDGRRHLFYAGSNTFPAGLKKRVKALLLESGYAVKVADKREKLPPADLTRLQPGMLSGIVLRDYQLESARRALKRGYGILWLATNAGKTEVASAMIKVLGEHRTLFLVHKKGLLVQARERIAKRLGTIEEHIGTIGEGRFDPKHITVATIQSLTRKGHSEKMKLIAQYLKTIKVLFIDEGHHTKATTWYRLINRIQAPFRYILSGTPFGNENGLMVEAAVGPVVARVTNAKLIELGVSAKPSIKMIEVREPVIEDGTWNDVYKVGIVLNTKRNELIVKQAARFAKEKKPCLVLVKELWHGDNLVTMLKSLKVSHTFVHGKMPQSQITQEKHHFEKGNYDVIIASPIFDEGVDVPAIKALIVADGGQSVRSVLQKIGRGLRQKEGENTLSVIDFADLTHRWLSKHALERLAIYEGEGFDVK